MTSLDAAGLRAALVAPAGPYAALDVVASTGSTNADLAAAAKTGAADRTVLIAERQTAGQGRRSRDWTSPAGRGLYLSVLLRPEEVPVSRLAWVTLLAGVALVRTAARFAVTATLKWPNDLLVGDAKCAGVLAEVDGGVTPSVVLGIGLNVLPLGESVPAGPGGLAATALAEHTDRELDRTEVAVALLRELAALDQAWRTTGGDAPILRAEYESACSTLHTAVRAELPGDRVLAGTAIGVDDDGQLLIATPDGTRHQVSAGDVVHLR